jgi:tetratricopeptide (TPR) repeat protein
MEIRMKMRKFVAITVLVLSSFAASNVAPSKAELETMYDKAFREFDNNNYPEALKQLDAIDARQPDLAESQNLRGVILMREGIYDKAEAALHEALRIDPKFWNARFNLAEIPFLQKNWGEARTRFQDLLTSDVAELQGDAAQLIQYKILLTYLLEGKENMVDSILAKFELSPDTPAVHYSNAAIALQRKDLKQAKDWMATAEKNFSPQLNKLFAESLYEVGWLEKQVGQSRAALEITSPAEKAAKAKAFARSRIEQAQQAEQQRDFAAARKFVDEADSADPNQPATLNLRGEILMEQKEFDLAEASFKKAAKIDPKFREVQYNLAQIPFKKKEYAKARDRFEALFGQTPGGDKNQAAQIIKFKIFMTLLLEGKESRAQKLMEQFQFTGDTPALYYAQAAWEFKHNNPNKATDWIASAKKIYSPSLNGLFSDSFYDLGWIQSPALAGSPAPATEAAAAMAAQTEGSPAIEPSPIPGTTVASKGKGSLASAAPAPTIAGMEATTSHAADLPGTALESGLSLGDNSVAAGSPAKPEEIPTNSAPSLSPTVETPVAASVPEASDATAREKQAAPVVAENSNATEPAQQQTETTTSSNAVAAASPAATILAPSHLPKETSPSLSERIGKALPEGRNVLVAALILVAASLIGWVVVPEIRRRLADMPAYHRPIPATGPSMDKVMSKVNAPISAAKTASAAPGRFFGGPRQVSLQLKASEPNLRRSVRPATKAPVARPLSVTAAAAGAAPLMEKAISFVEPKAVEVGAVADGGFESVGPVFEQGRVPSFAPAAEAVSSVPPAAPAPVEWWKIPPTPVEQEVHTVVSAPEPIQEILPVAEVVTPEPEILAPEPVVAEPEPAVVHDLVESAPEPVLEPVQEFEPVQELEPIGQGQPVPYEVPVFETEAPVVEQPATLAPFANDFTAVDSGISGIGALRESEDAPLFIPPVVSTEPSALQSTIVPDTMPEPTQMPNAPVIRTPTTGGATQPVSQMHTAVQLTFSFEIASMQLTPTFKMGALQLRPTSKIVTMRLSPSQQPQPAMNLQVNFEISKIQPTGGGLGTVRLSPSAQQRPAPTGSPSFTVAGLQLVSNFESAPVQLTPSQQASVLVTGAFQIATVEFSPAFEIASIVLNSSAKQVAVQLPGSTSLEGAARFDIANLQLGPSGEIGMMQLNLAGAGR